MVYKKNNLTSNIERPIIYIAISNHGFGHTTRTAVVANTIKKLCPEILVIIATTTPRWLLESYIDGYFIHRPRAFDLGVVQADCLTMNRQVTLEKLLEIRQNQNSIISSEANFIRQNRVNLILADIPFLVSKIARIADVPCWMMGNFGWNLIYRDWGGEFLEIADWVDECYSQSSRLFRLPFHEDMSIFPNITDVGLISSSPRYTEEDIRSNWGIDTPPEKTILFTFGSFGLQSIPYSNIRRFFGWKFITFDKSAPDLPNLIKINDPKWRPVDLMPVCGRLVSKPGFSTFAEAIKLGIPITSIKHGSFAEAAFLLEGIVNYSYHQIITLEDLFNGNWDFLQKPLIPPYKSEPIAKDGNEIVARSIITCIKK